MSIDLIANTASFSSAMSDMSKLSLTTSRNVQRSLNLIGTAATAMAASITAALTASIIKAEDFTYAVEQAALKTGTTSEMFSKLAYNAKLAGVPVDTLKQAMEKLAKTAGAANGGNRQALEAYGALGISAKELAGPLKNTGDLFVAVSKGLDKFGDSTNKTALEQKLLGRSGAELAPLIKQVATGFDTASKQATLFGVVVGDKTASQAETLHKSIVELESVALGFALRLLTGVSPALTDVSAKLIGIATSADGMKTVDRISGALASTITGLGDAFEFLFKHSTAVKFALSTLAAVQFSSIFLPLIAGAAKAGQGLDSIGLIALKMAGRLSGISAVVPILKDVTKAIALETYMITGLAREEGVASAASYGLARAQGAVGMAAKAAAGSVSAALSLLTAGVGVFGFALENERELAEKGVGVAVTWGDMWDAALIKVKERANELKLVWDVLHGTMDAKDVETWGNIKQNGILGENGAVVAGRIAKQHADMRRLFTPMDTSNLMPATAKKNAPALAGGLKPEKIDQLKLKMAELAASAASAQQMLADAGKGVDFQRADEITKEYTKTIIELEAHLKTQHKTLSDADKAAILASISTRVNSESQAKFRDGVILSTQQILAQADAQGILTAAIGKGAAAMRQAQVDSEFKTKNAGQSEEWLKANQDLINQQKAARMAELSASDAHTDTSALDGLKKQIDVQKMLNDAILAGRDAMNQSRLAAEKAAVTKQFADRGDTNQTALAMQLLETERLFNLQQSSADLQRAAGMNALRVYQDEAAAIRAAGSAATQAGQAISEMQLRAADKANFDSYTATIEKATLAVGGLKDGVSVFFAQMARGNQSAAEQVHDLLGGAFGDLNSALEKLVTTHTKTFYEFTREVKNDFAEMFRGISGSLAKLGIQKLESSLAGGLMKSLGIGTKSDPTVTAINGTNQRLDVLIGLSGGKAASSVASAVGSVAGAAKTSGSWLSGATSSVLGLIPGLGGLFGGFGGGRALGGDVQAGMTYNVGEMGVEKFTPSVNGKITPNKSLGRSGPLVGYIDARGSNDPSQTEAAIHRAMKVYGPHIVAQSVRAVGEKHARSPRG